jgi:hypothetical protein
VGPTRNTGNVGLGHDANTKLRIPGLFLPHEGWGLKNDRSARSNPGVTRPQQPPRQLLVCMFGTLWTAASRPSLLSHTSSHPKKSLEAAPLSCSPALLARQLDQVHPVRTSERRGSQGLYRGAQLRAAAAHVAPALRAAGPALRPRGGGGGMHAVAVAVADPTRRCRRRRAPSCQQGRASRRGAPHWPPGAQQQQRPPRPWPRNRQRRPSAAAPPGPPPPPRPPTRPARPAAQSSRRSFPCRCRRRRPREPRSPRLSGMGLRCTAWSSSS